MSNYLISSASSRIAEGKTIWWYWADHRDAKLEIQVLSVEPDERICYESSATGSPTTVELTFESIGEMITKVKIFETGWDKDDCGIVHLTQQTHGWVHFLCGLKAYPEHGISIRIGPF